MAGLYGKRKRSASGTSRMFAKRSRMSGYARRGLSKYGRKLAYRKSAVPTRLRGSRIQYSLNRAVGRVLNGLAENKVVSVTARNEYAPTPIQLAARCHYAGFVIGGVPSGWDSGLSNIGGTTITAGNGQNQRNGDSVYMRKTRLTFEIDAQPVGSDAQPVPKEYRMIIVKQNRKMIPTGSNPAPQTTLFLNTGGQEVGYQSPGFTGADAMLQPINRKQWSVFKDIRFRLSNPQIFNEAGTTNSWNWTSHKYGSTKRVFVDLPYYSKASFSSADIPENLDCHYACFIFAKSIGQDYLADDWEVNLRGTTSYKDM